MKLFVYKTLFAIIALFLLFELTISKKIKYLEDQINNIHSKENILLVKEKIKDEDLKSLKGMNIEMLALLAKENILTLSDFADLASYELIDKEEGLFRELELDEDLINQMIMDAREKTFS